MKDSIHVIDNIISLEEQDILESYFLKYSKWNFYDNTRNSYNQKFPQYSMAIRGYEFKKRKQTDKLPQHIEEIILRISTEVSQKLNLQFIESYRAKANLMKKEDYDANRNEKLGIHIDRFEDYVGMIYYINNTDGDTYFYNDHLKDKKNWVNYVSDTSNFEHFEFRENVKPKKGRIVVFDGMLFHHSTYPKLNDRYIINFNEVIKETKAII